jgi:predicted nucleic acid-binding protein
MSARFFLDTNIFVYSCDRTSQAKARIAESLIADAVASRRGIISYQVIEEFLNLALRRFANPMSPSEAERYLYNILQPILGIHSSLALYTEALHVQSRFRLSWYDALIVTAAIEADCAVLYSEDLQHGQRFGSTRVQNPFV